MSTRELFKTVLASLMAVAAVGCNGNSSSSQVLEVPTQTRMTIHANGQTFVSYGPANLKLSLGATPELELGVSGAVDGAPGAANTQSWSVIAFLTTDQASQGAVNVTLSNGPTLAGVGSLGMGSTQQGLEQATGGTLQATIAKGKIEGQAQATPAELSGDFNGDISIECWIPRTGPVTNGTTDDSGSEVLIEDQDMTSPACQPFRALRQ